MNLSNVEELKSFLRSSGLRPKDYLGQNFLVDEEALQNIVSAANLKSTDTVLEVGPGLGVLTLELVKHSQKVVAVEKDPQLFEMLKRQGIKNLEIHNEDILKFYLEQHLTGPYKLVANIPYYLTSKLLQNFLEQKNQPELAVLMIQKEVGERVTAPAGELSILGISVQIYADAEIMMHVPKTSFWPQPEVDSVILKITPRNKYPEITDKKLFFRIVKLAFAGKRKQIHNTLANGLKVSKEVIAEILTGAKIDGAMRPQDLTIEDWIRLYGVIQDRNL